MYFSYFFQETDFVCFDTGFNGHDDYDIDSLLGYHSTKQDWDNEDTVDQTEPAGGAEIPSESTDRPTEIASMNNDDIYDGDGGDDDDEDDVHDDGGHDASHNTDVVPEEPSADSLPAGTTESARQEAEEQEPGAASDVTQTHADHSAAHEDHSTAHEPPTAGDSTLENAELDQGEADGGDTDDLTVDPVPLEDGSTAGGPTSTVASDNETGMASPHDETMVKPVPGKDPEAGVVPASLLKKSVPELKMASQTPDEDTTNDEEEEEEEEDDRDVIPVDEAKSEEPIKDVEYNMIRPRVPGSGHPNEGPSETQKAFNNNDDDDEEEEDDDDDDDTPVTKNRWSSIGDTVFAIVSGGRRTAEVSISADVMDKVEETTSEKRAATDDVDINVPPAKKPPYDDQADEDTLIFLEADTEDIDHEAVPLVFNHQRNNDKKHGAVEHTTDQEHERTDQQATEENPQEIFTAQDPNPRKLPAHPSSHPRDTEAPEEPTEPQVSGNPELGEENDKEEDDEDTYDDDDDADDDDAVQANDVSVRAGEGARDLKEEETLTRHEEGSVMEKENYTDAPEGEDRLLRQGSENSVTELENNVTQETENNDDLHTDEELPSKEYDLQEEELERGELLEDENALSHSDPSKEINEPSPEPEYGDDVLRLTLMRSHFTDEDMQRLRKFLSLSDLLRAEALFADLDLELQAARLNDVSPAEDIEKSLDAILETSENAILDEIEKMLDSRDPKPYDGEHTEAVLFDEEAQLLDEFQELVFKLRQKYSAASDSTPLTANGEPVPHQGVFLSSP